MARQVRRISELPEAAELTGDELLEIVQDGDNFRLRVDQLPGGAVQSVQGRTGDVVITAADVGLGNVDDTSDADKPVSTAQQAALDGKVDKVAGMGLSSNDFTDLLRDKLEDVQPWATAPTQDAAQTALGMSASGKTVATGTPAQGRTALGLGTAATGSVTATPTDRTAGRLLRVGDAGIHGNIPIMAGSEVADWDTLQRTSSYSVRTTEGLNRPSAAWGGFACMGRWSA